jgi:hypothetical protein
LECQERPKLQEHWLSELHFGDKEVEALAVSQDVVVVVVETGLAVDLDPSLHLSFLFYPHKTGVEVSAIQFVQLLR